MVYQSPIFLYALVALCSTFSGVGERENPQRQHVVDADSWFAETVATSGIVGLSACVVSGDRVVWKDGFGKADMEQNIPVTTETVFMMASCSKLFTSCALLKLYESGHFDLDGDVNRFLPFPVRNPAFPDSAITFRMLITHTSSIADRQEVITSLYGTGESDMPLDVFLTNYFRPDGDYYDALNFHGFIPGTRTEYSNVGYALIGYLAERISQEPFPDFCREALFAPLETCVLFEPATRIGFVLLITGPFEDLGVFMEMVDVLMAQGAAG